MTPSSRRQRLRQFKETLSRSMKSGAGSGVSHEHGLLTTAQLIKYVLIFLSILSVIAWYFLAGPSRNLHGSAYNKNLNAVWAQHAWVDTKHTPDEIRSFVETLGTHGVKYVFLHVGPLDSSGLISPERYGELADFLATARVYGDRLVFIPWMGQLRSKLPLEKASVRQNIVSMSKLFVNDYGMAGVHFDVEPIMNGDSDFLFLLDDVKKAIGSNKILSVALAEYVPDYVYKLAQKFMKVNDFLAKEYIERVDGLVDQTVIMTYENSIRDGRMYAYFLKNEIIWMTNLLKHSRLLVGLPTYDTPSETFHPDAENISFGLRGVVDGLNSWRSVDDVFEGVALYGAWTTDAGEWSTMDRIYLKKPDAH